MSIYIKGIKAPKDCRECAFIKYSSISGTTYCGVTGDVLAVDFRPIPFEGISEKCPIEEIPPHGRLIDADRLLTDKMKSKYYHLPNGDIAIPLIDIEHAPIVVEGSEVNGKTD